MISSDGITTDDLEVQHQYYLSHPPTCLSAFDVEPIKESNGDLEFGWMIRCKCGASDFNGRVYSLAHPDRPNENALVSPIALICTSCGKDEVIFDSNKHGYDPVTTGKGWSIYGPEQPDAKQITLACPKCKNQKMRYFASFRYADDMSSDDYSDFRKRCLAPTFPCLA